MGALGLAHPRKKIVGAQYPPATTVWWLRDGLGAGWRAGGRKGSREGGEQRWEQAE